MKAVRFDSYVPAERINTIADFEAMARFGVNAQGSTAAASKENLAELARLVASGEVEVPIARTYPLEEVRSAFDELSRRHTRGKIVLIP